jgi:hypothetical protein
MHFRNAVLNVARATFWRFARKNGHFAFYETKGEGYSRRYKATF